MLMLDHWSSYTQNLEFSKLFSSGWKSRTMMKRFLLEAILASDSSLYCSVNLDTPTSIHGNECSKWLQNWKQSVSLIAVSS